ncbi:hypothetical protein X975_08991, partial [Stegodyphus mimosarum]
MGSSNRALWSLLDVSVSRTHRKTSYNIRGPDVFIHSIADVPHLIKNRRSVFLSNILILPEELHQQHGLPSRIMSSVYVKQHWSSEIESDAALRSLHHLNRNHLFPTHFSLMNVAYAVQLFSVKTASALEKAVILQQVAKGALTSARWIRLVAEWSTIMTARH